MRICKREITWFMWITASAGVDRDQLLRRSLVAPSDGLGAFAPEQVAGVVSVVDALAQRIHEHVASTLTPVLA